MSQARVLLYDTTLRDGTQAEDVALTLEDKLLIAEKLDGLGIDRIEGGWPGSNPKDMAFFTEVRRLRLKHAKVAAFGMTRRAGVTAGRDLNLKALVDAQTECVTLVGKTWDFHVHQALRVSLDENLRMIEDSIAFLKKRVPEVMYDAEHFFDGYRENPDYALKTLAAAVAGGADWLVLCDTNGGTLPTELGRILDDVVQRVDRPIGIHCHNDSECAVANSVLAVEKGARQVQGTINGIGERCGNANLCSIIPNLKLKRGIDCVSDAQLKTLKEVSRFVAELANMTPSKHQAYVGESAFAHKGGMHVSAIRRHSKTYEHVAPERVGNRQRVLVSDLSGQSNVLSKAEEFGLDLSDRKPEVRAIVERLKELESEGYQFEGAEGSFELLVDKALNGKKNWFELRGFRVIDEKREAGRAPYSEATIRVEVNGVEEHTAAEGHGPVNALDNALRKALERFYPEIKSVQLLDYKVRVLKARAGTSARVRVLIESGDGVSKWGTVGVSENIIEASWQALVDSLVYKLHTDAKKKGRKRVGQRGA
ncbi:MAG: citramalate synthase [bacterium]